MRTLHSMAPTFRGSRAYPLASTVRLLAGLAALPLASVGCGDEADPTTYPGLLTFDPFDDELDAGAEGDPRDAGKPGSSMADAGKPTPRDAGTKTDPDGGDGDGDAEDPGPSNTPWAELRYVGTGPSAGISVVASNFTQEPSADEYYVQWYIVLENTGDEPVCSVLIYATFRDDDGGEILKLTAGVDAMMFASTYSPTSVVECIPVGAKVGGYANGFIPAEVDIQKFARIDYTIGGSIGANAIVTPPTVGNQMIVPKYNGYALTGTLTASNFALINPSVNVYPLTAAGMPIERIGDIDLITVYAYGSWDFSTTTADALFDDYLLSVQYDR